MPRPPTKHGLEKKFKPWRKGKSKAATQSIKSPAPLTSGPNKTRGSLKNQLRSERRFLAKISKTGGEESNMMQKAVEERIKEIEQQISAKEKIAREKKLAAKYHNIKFFERQKLTRMERTARRKLEEARAAADFSDVQRFQSELESIAFDQLYVANFPNDTKYVALFANNGGRACDDTVTANKRLAIRKRIADMGESGEGFRKAWVNYTVLENKRILGNTNKDRNEELVIDQNVIDDDGLMPNNEVHLRNCMSELEHSDNEQPKEKEPASIQNRNDGGDVVTENKEDFKMDNRVLDLEQADNEELHQPTDSKFFAPPIIPGEVVNNGDAESERSGISSIICKGGNDKCFALENKGSDSDAVASGTNNSPDSDSSDFSDSDSDTVSMNDVESTPLILDAVIDVMNSTANEGDESEDDFLVDDREVDNEEQHVKAVFAKARFPREACESNKKGDKSKGWKTQKQRPNEWKRPRTRR